MSILLVFDLNGCLCRLNSNKIVTLRANACSTLDKLSLSGKYTIAFWTSKRHDNAMLMTNKILMNTDHTIPLFVWSQDHCTKEYDPENPFGGFIKDLTKIFTKYPKYNESNTYLIDDTYKKCRLQPHCYLPVTTFTSLMGDIPNPFEALLTRCL